MSRRRVIELLCEKLLQYRCIKDVKAVKFKENLIFIIRNIYFEDTHNV